METKEIPSHDQIRKILTAEGAPPYIVLDIGGSADLNGDGLVRAQIGIDGELDFEDV